MIDAVTMSASRSTPKRSLLLRRYLMNAQGVHGGVDGAIAYQYLLLDRITRIEGVTGVHSSFVLHRVVDNSVVGGLTP